MTDVITFNDTIFQKRLSEVLNLLKGNQKQELMQQIGVQAAASIQRNFDRQSDKQGEEWTPSVRAIKQHGKTLENTGRMRMIGFSADSDSVLVGTTVDYGVYHQYGSPVHNLPKREWLYLTQDAVGRITKTLENYFKKVSK